VIANVPLVFGVLHYSRTLEDEADEFAIALLQANGISTRPLLEFFSAMEDKSRKDGHAAPPAFLSTHPATERRQQRLREAAR
jgi:predicted Zn-dependent protease